MNDPDRNASHSVIFPNKNKAYAVFHLEYYYKNSVINKLITMWPNNFRSPNFGWNKIVWWNDGMNDWHKLALT